MEDSSPDYFSFPQRFDRMWKLLLETAKKGDFEEAKDYSAQVSAMLTNETFTTGAIVADLRDLKESGNLPPGEIRELEEELYQAELRFNLYSERLRNLQRIQELYHFTNAPM